MRSLKAGWKERKGGVCPFWKESPVSTFSHRAVLVRYLAYLDARPRKPSSAQDGDVEGVGGWGGYLAFSSMLFVPTRPVGEYAK